LVVQFDRHVGGAAKPARERPGGGRLRALLARHPDREADDHPAHAGVADELDQLAEPLWRVGARDRGQRRGQRPARVRDRAAAASRAVVEREHPRHESARSIASLAAAIASGSLSGARPPACAIVSRPPPPPPTISAATLTTSTAFTPRSTAAGATFATRCTRPSSVEPSTTAPSPSACFTRSESSSSSRGSGTSTTSVTTRTP